jgi:hypothetical protein
MITLGACRAKHRLKETLHRSQPFGIPYNLIGATEPNREAPFAC